MECVFSNKINKNISMNTAVQQIVALSSLVSAKQNSNKMTPERYAALKLSIRKKGFLQPILVVPIKGSEGLYRIVDGHHRVKALTELGETLVTAVVADLSPEEIEALSLGMNRARGDIDLGIAAEIISTLVDVGWLPEDLQITGFSPSELEALTNLEDPMEELVASVEEPKTKQSRTFTLKVAFSSMQERDRAEDLMASAMELGNWRNSGDLLVSLLER